MYKIFEKVAELPEKGASRRHDDSNIGGTHVKRTFIKETS